MKNMVWVWVAVLVASFGCKTKKEEPAAPPAAKVETPPAEAPKPPPPPAEKPSDCAFTIKMTPTDVAYAGVDRGRSLDLDTGKAAMPKPDEQEVSSVLGTALTPIVAKCPGKLSATLTATPDVVYQDVVRVMDLLSKLGIKDIAFGDAKADPSKMSPASSDSDLKHAPVVIMTKTEVKVWDKSVGKPADAGLADAIKAGLLAGHDKPSDPTFIIQADQSLTYAAIINAINGAAQAGYTNALFAVKNK